MAVATIKDLLDPLTKIQAATESSAASLDAFTAATAAQMQGEVSILKKLDRLIEVSSGAKMNTFDLIMWKNSKEQTKLLRIIAKGKESGGKKSSGKGTGKIKAGAGALKSLGEGAVALAKGLILFRIVPKKTILKFQDFVKDQIEIWEKSKPKKMEKGANAMLAMGDAIYSFAKSLALASILLIPAAIGIPLLYLATLLLVPLFVLLGKRSKQIRKGAKAIDRMGDGLKSFAVGLAVFALATMFILMKPVILLGMVASLLLIGGTVAILGKFSKTIRKGSVAIGAMGIGLATFGIGYAIFAVAIKLAAPSVDDVLVQAAVLIGIGIVTALLGAVFEYILKGALAIAVMGLGLVVFGWGYTPFAEATKGYTSDDVANQGALLLMLGLEFAAAGFAGIFIGAGALAFAAIGGALWALSEGLLAFKKVDFTEEDAVKLTATLAGVKSAFLGTEGKDSGGGIFSKIGGAISGAIDSGGMVAAAAGFAAAGWALTKLSGGLVAYKAVGWTDELSLTLAAALTGISGAFAAAGGEAATPTGLFGDVFGNAFSPNATEKGIDSVMDAGKALTSITEGLVAFQKLVDKEVDFDVLAAAIGTTVGVVQTAFAAIGGEGTVEAGGFFNSLFGIKKNKVEEGIDSVMDAGKALTSIVDGLIAFQALVDRNVDFTVLGTAIGDTIGFVQRAFSAVAEEGNVEAGGFFNSLFGIKKNKVEEGIDSVAGAGKVLVDIVDGLVGFQALVEKNIDFTVLGKAIGDTISFVQKAFVAVADEGNVEAGGFFNSLFGIKKNKVKEGVDSVSGAGDELVKIADALTAFEGLKDPKDTAKKIKTVLGLVGTAFASIGGSENEEADGNWLISWDENKIAKGIEAVDGAGNALTDIAAGLKAFSGDFEPVKVANSVATLLTSIGTAFSNLYATNPLVSDQLRDFSGFIVTLGDVADKGLLDKAADGISKIADSINKIDIDKTVAFGDLFKSSAKLSEDDDAYDALAKAVEEIRDIMQEQKGPSLIDRGLDAVGLGGDKPAAAVGGEAAKSGTDPMKKLNSTLGRLESAITALPAAIQTMKLEVSIPDS